MKITPGTFPPPFVYKASIPLIGHGAINAHSLFRNGHGVVYWIRDDNLDRWFCECDHAVLQSTARIVTFGAPMRFQDMARSVARCAKGTIGALSRSIAKRQLDITRTQWDALIKLTESTTGINEECCLSTESVRNFAFAKTGKTLTDKDGEYPEIVVLSATCDTDGLLDDCLPPEGCLPDTTRGEWAVRVYRLGDENQQRSDCELVLRNNRAPRF